MAFFRTVSFSEQLPAIDGRRRGAARAADVRLCRMGVAARGEPGFPHALGADLAGRRSHPRGLPPAASSATPRISAAISPIRSSCSARSDRCLVGGLTLANIRRGVAQAGSLGYWMGAAYARRGYMTAAVRALLPFAFGTLRLHRIEAACIPTNAASIRLLEKTRI